MNLRFFAQLVQAALDCYSDQEVRHVGSWRDRPKQPNTLNFVAVRTTRGWIAEVPGRHVSFMWRDNIFRCIPH